MGMRVLWLLHLLQITGIASTADYLDYLPGADEFRKHAPGYAAWQLLQQAASSKQQHGAEVSQHCRPA